MEKYHFQKVSQNISQNSCQKFGVEVKNMCQNQFITWPTGTINCKNNVFKLYVGLIVNYGKI